VEVRTAPARGGGIEGVWSHSPRREHAACWWLGGSIGLHRDTVRSSALADAAPRVALGKETIQAARQGGGCPFSCEHDQLWCTADDIEGRARNRHASVH
jgi:hypothetical protein